MKSYAYLDPASYKSPPAARCYGTFSDSARYEPESGFAFSGNSRAAFDYELRSAGVQAGTIDGR